MISPWPKPGKQRTIRLGYAVRSRWMAFFMCPSFLRTNRRPLHRAVPKVRSIEIKSCLPSGPDGFQTDMIRDTAEHSLHSLLRLPHKAQCPCRHVLFVCRSILLLRHDLQNQSIQHSEIQILRPAEDHPIDLNGWGSLQKNSRSAAQRLCKSRSNCPSSSFSI